MAPMSATATEADTEIVKASDLAKRYKTTPSLIYKWARDGKIPSIQFQGTVRFDLAAVRAVIEGGSK